jgi:aspartate/methionine/tyrosine aminotransferase
VSSSTSRERWGCASSPSRIESALVPALADLHYLRWAHRLYPRITRYDLASSGTPDADAAILGEVALSDYDTWYAFRDRIAARFGLPSAQAFPTLGVSNAIWLACAAILEPGDQVIVETPTYEPLHVVPAGLGAEVRRVRRPLARDFDPDPDEIEAAMNERTKMVLLTSPHNPSGHPVKDETLARIHALCAARDAWLFVDEVYAAFGTGPPKTARRIGDRVLAASSHTKRWGLGWARAGWLLGPEELLAGGIATAVRHVAGQTGSPHTALGLAAFDTSDSLDARADAFVGRGAARVDAWVAKHGALEWRKPPAGFHGFVHVEGDVDVRPRVEEAAEEHGLIVAPGEFFGERRSAFRVGWTKDDDTVDEALPLLAEVLSL